MGVEPFLVTSTVEGVMAQRLVRTLCKECREEYQPNPDELPDGAEIRFAPDLGVNIARGDAS